jgi:hypothetical protein
MPFPGHSHLNQPLGLETIGPLASPMLGDKLHAVQRHVDLMAADIHLHGLSVVP